MHTPRRARSPLVLALPLVLAACGAKTGLLVPEPVADVPDVIDVPDVPDVPDVTDVMDVPDVPDVPDVQDVPDVCVPRRFEMERRSAELMFVVDRSGSMAFALNGEPALGSTPTRWGVLRDAFAASLPGIARTLPFGAKFFPREIDPGMQPPVSVTCVTEAGVDLAPALGNTAAMLRVFDDTSPFGPTPTWDALDKTIRFLRARPGRGVSRAILLATDGGPNCAAARPAMCRCTNADSRACDPMGPNPATGCLDDTRTLSLLREAAQPTASGVQAIPVFVVGIDNPIDRGPDFRDVLEAMAEAGGRPRREPGRPAYYSIRRPEDFTAAFDAVVRSVQRCTWVTPTRPADPDALDLELDGLPLRRDPTRTDGWDWTDRDFGEVTFFGPACERASREGSRLTARTGCRDE